MTVPARVLVTGGGGQLARALDRVSAHHDWVDEVSVELTSADVTDPQSIGDAVAAAAPDLVVHAAAWTDVDGCELDPTRAWCVHVDGTRRVADAAAAQQAHLVLLSTNFVFDGTATGAHGEADPCRPANAYGETKRAAELVVPASATIVRTGWLCGDGPRNLVAAALRLLEQGQAPVAFVDDVWGQPTEADGLAGAILRLGLDRAPGTWHVAGPEVTTPYELARQVATAAGLDPAAIVRAGPHDPIRSRPAARPANGVLALDRWAATGAPPLAPLRDAVPRLIAHLRAR